MPRCAWLAPAAGSKIDIVPRGPVLSSDSDFVVNTAAGAGLEMGWLTSTASSERLAPEGPEVLVAKRSQKLTLLKIVNAGKDSFRREVGLDLPNAPDQIVLARPKVSLSIVPVNEKNRTGKFKLS